MFAKTGRTEKILRTSVRRSVSRVTVAPRCRWSEKLYFVLNDVFLFKFSGFAAAAVK